MHYPKLISHLLLALTFFASPVTTLGLDYKSLRQLIEQQNITSIESLLAQIPEKDRSNYVLMFNSRSLHGASFNHPRAILFREDSNLIISFNGDSAQKGFYALEVVEYNDSAAEFEYHEILFPDSLKSPRQVSFSEANPAKCGACHGAPAHPIWDTQPLWPGAYGEYYLSPLSAPEKNGIQAFLKELPTHPRYKYLLKSEIFAQKETFIPSAADRYYNAVTESPNFKFNRFLQKLNVQQIVNSLVSSKEFLNYKFALLASLETNCGEVGRYFPPEFRAEVSNNFNSMKAIWIEKNKLQTRQKKRRALNRSDKLELGSATDSNSLLAPRFISEKLMGVKTNHWSMEFESDAADFSGSLNFAKELEKQLLRKLAPAEQKLAALGDEKNLSSSDRYCRYLEKQSLIALKNQDPLILTKAAPQDAPKFLQTCASCHVGSIAPAIPFAESPKLIKLLNVSAYPRGTLLDEIKFRLSELAGAQRMPLGLNLTDEERQELLTYFNQLAMKSKANAALQ